MTFGRVKMKVTKDQYLRLVGQITAAVIANPRVDAEAPYTLQNVMQNICMQLDNILPCMPDNNPNIEEPYGNV